MRIVAGKYRGKKLKEFDLSSTRPTTDRVKESIFNLIQFDISNAVVLDLFSGTGALGVECLSRGAKKVYFVDDNIEAIKIIKSNLTGIEGNFDVKNMDYLEFLLKSKNEKFDIVLLDPPFASDFGERAIKFLILNNMIAENGKIIFETSADKTFNFEFPTYTIRKKKYGKIAVYKFEKN